MRRNGASFAVVTAEPVTLPGELVALNAVNVVAPQAVGESYAVVVRPDRYVAGIARDHDDLCRVATTLRSHVV